MSYQALHRQADRMVPALRLAFLRVLEKLKRDLTGDELQQALESHDPYALARLGYWAVFTASLLPVWHEYVSKLILGGAQVGSQSLPDSIGVQLRFDLSNPHVPQAIDTIVNDSLSRIVNANQAGIVKVLRDGYNEGVDAPTLARRIRQYVGSSDRDATALQTYRAGLETQEVAPGRVDDLVADMAARQVRRRSTVIARTETIRASSAGQQIAWKEAQTAGLLDPKTVKRFWIVTPDDRLCPTCEAIPLAYPNGVGLDEWFGDVQYPPAHVQCRCAVALHFGEEA